MKNPVNITPPKKMNKAPVTGPKEMEIYKLSKIQNNPLKKFREIKETIYY